MKTCVAVGILGAMIVAVYASPRRDLNPPPDNSEDFGIPNYFQSESSRPIPISHRQERSLDSYSEQEYQNLKKSSLIVPESDRRGAEATAEAKMHYYPDGSPKYTDFLA